MLGKTISHYRIIEKLGEGGMGVVYKAEDTKLKRTVALKFLPPELTRDHEAKKRFVHEAQAASALDHSNICTIYEIDEIPTEGRDQTFIAMACYDGETLRSKIQKGPLSLDDAINITVQIAQGLQEAHEKGIVHRDIKPANIMVTSKGQVKIMDFGLAKLGGRTKLTKTGTTLGTVSYMSPEQTKGKRVDHRSDIWSLGAVLYEMITGQLPFKGDYEQAVVYSIMNEAPERMTGLRTGVPVQLENMIDKTLAKSPDDRYQHIQEFVVDLRRLKKQAESEGLLSKIATVPGRTRKRIPRLLIAFAGIFAVLFMAVILYQIIISSLQKRDSDIPKLVVLPFENLGSEDDTYFADGITEEIMTRLATVSSLGVISRNSAFHYANLSKTTKQIGNELDVAYIVSGTVRWARSQDGPGRVRVMPRLIRVQDDLQLWAQPYERVVDDIFEIQTDIAKKVVEKLGLSLLKPELEAVEINPTENLEAYQAFLQGRHMTRQPHFTIENWEQVIRSYRRAVQLDPGFALAHAELAKAHSRLYFLRHDLSETRLNMAKEAADRALALKPNSSEVRLSLGYYHLWAHRNPQGALEEWTIAEKGLPNNSRILEAKFSVFQLQGRFEEAIETAKAAVVLSPRDASLATDLALFLILTRDYSPAIEACNHAIALAPDELWPYLYKVLANWMWKGATPETRRILEGISFEQVWVTWFWIWQEIGERRFSEALERVSSHPGVWIQHKMWAIPKSMFRGFIYTFQNRSQDALQSFEAAKRLLEAEVQKFPEDPRYHSSLGMVYGALGYEEEAVREGKRAVELLPISEDAVYGISYEMDLAISYTLIGDYDSALDRVEYLLSIPSWISPGWLHLDFRYAPLYDHPRFKKLSSQHTGDYR